MRTRWPGLVVLAFALGTALTGCAQGGTNPQVASANGAGTTASPGADGENLSDAEKRVKFTQCMREKGVDMPDPEEGETGGGFKIELGDPKAGGPAPKDVEAAMQTCRKYLPNGGEPPKLDAAQLEQMRKYSKCMRENGVAAFPDPEPGGMLKIEAGPGTGLDPRDPTFKAAEKKCESLRPGLGEGGPAGGQGPGGGSITKVVPGG